MVGINGKAGGEPALQGLIPRARQRGIQGGILLTRSNQKALFLRPGPFLSRTRALHFLEETR